MSGQRAGGSAPTPVPSPSCAECGKKHSTSTAHLLGCQSCHKHYHHSTCLRPPLQGMSQAELGERLRNDGEAFAIRNTHNWECGPCQVARVKAEATATAVKPSCAECRKGYSTSTAYLLECRGCRRHWHHSTCLRPPSQPMQNTEFNERTRNANKKAPSYNLRDWECGTCRAKVDAITIDDSDEEIVSVPALKQAMRQNPKVEVFDLTGDIPAIHAPPRPSQRVTIREESPEIIFLTSPPPPPPSAPARSNASHPLPSRPTFASGSTASRSTASQSQSPSIRRSETLKDSTPTAPKKLVGPPRRTHRAPLPPQEEAFRSHVDPAPPPTPPQAQPSVVLQDVPQSRPAAPSERPEDNLRGRYGPPRTRHAHDNPAVVQPNPAHNRPVPVEQQLSQEEAELLDSFAHIKIETPGESVLDSGSQIRDGDGDDEELDVSQAGWPEGYVEPPLDELYNRWTKASSYFSVTAAFSQGVHGSKKSRDNMIPRFDMFYQDFPNPGDFPAGEEGGDCVAPARQESGRRRSRKVTSSRLDPELVGPEVIYVAPKNRFKKAAPGGL